MSLVTQPDQASPPSTSSARRRQRAEWLALLVLAGMVVATFAMVVRCDFVNYDDDVYATGNAELRQGLTPAGLRWALVGSFTNMVSRAHSVSVAHWHPLVWLTLHLDYELYGLAPWGYHLTNLLWHLGSTLLLFLALRRLTGVFWCSLIVAGLFAVHPLNVQTVAWVSERKGLVSAFFFMLTLWAYALYAERPSWQRYCLVALSLTLGLQAKQTLVTLPCVLLLVDFWPLGRWNGAPRGTASAPRSLGWLVVEKLPLLALGLAFTLLVLVAQWLCVTNPAPVLPFGMRLGNAIHSYAAYLAQAFVPIGLAAHYPHPLDSLTLGQVAAEALVLITVSVVAALHARQVPYLAVGWFWYLGTLLPLTGVVQQLGSFARADRYVYVPMVGIYMAVVWGLAELAQRQPRLRPALAGLAALALAACILISRREVEPWRNGSALWQHAVDVGAPSGVAYTSLGCAVAADDPKRARAYFEAALRLDPAMEPALINLTTILLSEGNTAAAIERCQAALARYPDLGTAQRLLGQAYIKQNDLGQAAVHLREAVRLNPDDVNAHATLGWVGFQSGDMAAAQQHFRIAQRLDSANVDAHYHLGLILLRGGDRAGAAEHFRTVLELRPSDELAHLNLGIILKDQGNQSAALGHLQKALRLKPDLAAAHYHLGLLLVDTGRLDEASAHLQETIRLLPGAAPAYVSLGKLRLRQGDAAAAARCFDEARKIDPGAVQGETR